MVKWISTILDIYKSSIEFESSIIMDDCQTTIFQSWLFVSLFKFGFP